jgi:hypothetical protein
MEAAWMVPGHGEPLQDARDTIDLNLAVLERAMAWLRDRVRRAPAGSEDLLVEFASALGMRIADPPSYVLNRATMLGCLSSLERAGEIRVSVEGGRWVWMAGGEGE